MHTNLFCRALSVLLLSLGSGAAVANVQSPYALSAEFENRGPTKGVLTLQVLANTDLSHCCAVAVVGSPNLYVDSGPKFINLGKGALARIPVVVEWLGGEDSVGYVSVRVVSGDTEIGYSRPMFYVGILEGTLSLLNTQSRDSLLNAARRRKETFDGESRASVLVSMLRERRRRLLPSQVVLSLSGLSLPGAANPQQEASEVAFDKAVGTDWVEPCSKLFYDSADNIYYHLVGRPQYHDPQLGDSYALGNNPVTVKTQVQRDNQCGDSTVEPRFYTANAVGDRLDMWVSSITPPGTNPVLSLATTFPDVGTLSGTSPNFLFAADSRTLSGASVSGDFSSPSTWTFDSTTFTAADSYIFLWQALIRQVRERWQTKDSTFDGFTQNFRAGYFAADSGNNAFFIPPSAVIEFGSLAEWPSPYLVAHESGHFLQYNLQGGNWAVGGGGDWDQCMDLNGRFTTAFQEGFADFCSAIGGWDGQSPYPQARSPQYQPIIFCEAGECHRTACVGLGENWSLNVTSFFWDLFDNHPDSTWDVLNGQQVDNVSLPFSRLLGWRASPVYTDFQQFFNDFATRGLFASDCPAVQTIETLNGMTEGTCP